MLMSTSASAAPATPGPPTDDHKYEEFLTSLRQHFRAMTSGGEPLFTTDATGLYDAFLEHIGPEHQQHYRCNACRRFVDRFGGLVRIEPAGVAVPVMWGPSLYPPFFRLPTVAVSGIVLRSKVTGVFLTDEKVWGTPQNRGKHPSTVWHHMAVMPSAVHVLEQTPLLTPGQVMAAKREEYDMLRRALADFSIDVVRQAHALLSSGQLYRSEKALGAAEWLLLLHSDLHRILNERPRENRIWLAVASAPAGFCHVRSGVLGTLLEDIQTGLPFEQIQRRFAEKMDPQTYQRAQVAPTAGNVAQAEKVVSALQAAGALNRRFARLEDIPEFVWRPALAASKPEASNGGVFGHLATKGAPDKRAAGGIATPAVVMTWEKFARTVLPTAATIELFTPSAMAWSYAALVTAVDPSAPPILQWDRPEKRNPVSWFLYVGGSLAPDWGLAPDQYHPVTGITLQPSMWHGGGFDHHGKKVFFLIEGAKDVRCCRGQSKGSLFFPDTLRSEFHPVRATMEAFAKQGVLAGAEEATACGLALQSGVPWYRPTFRVTTKDGIVSTYDLDRWD